ncbi:MAG: hypothetical protein ACOX70_06590, partial [Syntrophaceticus schinkii]
KTVPLKIIAKGFDSCGLNKLFFQSKLLLIKSLNNHLNLLLLLRYFVPAPQNAKKKSPRIRAHLSPF